MALDAGTLQVTRECHLTRHARVKPNAATCTPHGCSGSLAYPLSSLHTSPHTNEHACPSLRPALTAVEFGKGLKDKVGRGAAGVHRCPCAWRWSRQPLEQPDGCQQLLS